MAINKKEKGTILVGIVGAVAVILGLVFAGFYSTNFGLAEPVPEPEEKQSDQAVNDNGSGLQDEIEAESSFMAGENANAVDDAMAFAIPSNKAEQQPEAVVTSDAPVPIEEPMASEQPNAVVTLECSVPSSIRRGSDSSFSAILFDSNLDAYSGQSISWDVSPGGLSFTSITQAGGTTEVTPDLSPLPVGNYDVVARFESAGQEAACAESFDLTSRHSNAHSSSADDSADVTRPGLSITMPASGDTFTGPSSGGIPVYVTGTASDDGSIQSVEVRWDAWYGLTGYRMADSAGTSGDWSTWSYDGIKFSTDGTKKILAKSTDAAGNKSWKIVEFEVLFTEDNTRPVIEISAPVDGSVITGPAEGVTVLVTGTASDFYEGLQNVEVRTDLSGYELATLGSPSASSTWSHEVTFATSGMHQIVTRATDNAENMQWKVINVTVQLGGPDT